MFFCNQCKSNKVRTRVNYSHGKKGGGKSTPVDCKSCGATDIEFVPNTRFGRTIRRG